MNHLWTIYGCRFLVDKTPLRTNFHRMHKMREQQSLALHREIAARLRREPALIEHALANLNRWIARHGEGPLKPAYTEWKNILETQTLDEILKLITTESLEAARLRQNSPFAGILPPQEVWRIKKQFVV